MFPFQGMLNSTRATTPGIVVVKAIGVIRHAAAYSIEGLSFNQNFRRRQTLCQVEDRSREPQRSDDARFPTDQIAECAYDLIDRPASTVAMHLVTVCSSWELAR